MRFKIVRKNLQWLRLFVHATVYQKPNPADRFWYNRGMKHERFEQKAHRPPDSTYDKTDARHAFALEGADGAWLVKKKGDDKGVPVPDELARLIKVAITAQARLTAGRYSSPSLRQEPLVRAIAYGLNCHRLVRYILGLPISKKYDEGFAILLEKLPGFDNQEYGSYEQVIARLETVKDGFPLVGRITSKYEEIHSFVVLGKNAEGEYICFEKSGAGDFPLRILPLQDIYAFYGRRAGKYWGFQGLEQAKVAADTAQVKVALKGGSA